MLSNTFFPVSLPRLLTGLLLWTHHGLSRDTSRVDGCLVIVDLTVKSDHRACSNHVPTESRQWHRISKDLYLNSSKIAIYLHVADTPEQSLITNDVIVAEIRVGNAEHSDLSSSQWESRPHGLRIRKENYTGLDQEVITEVDVLFGSDAVDPRDGWTLLPTSFQLDDIPGLPSARLTVRRGRAQPRKYQEALHASTNGKFKLLQISDQHMVTGPGACKNAIDAHGQVLPPSVADPLTVKFMEEVLDDEKPNLVLLTGDQLHHDILDSQSTLFKSVAPMIERKVPYASVFGNHDSEGKHVLSRASQMSILHDLPFSLSQAGPEELDGVGNYYLQIYPTGDSSIPSATIYLLDSHAGIESQVQNPDYEPIKQSQIDWFISTSQSMRHDREHQGHNSSAHISLAFFHIPFPEFSDPNLVIKTGHRREPTEGPSVNTHFYDALSTEGIDAVGCGHDHVNDFCAYLPRRNNEPSSGNSYRSSPWLCYGGGSGFGGYGSWGGNYYHRRMRVWELDTKKGTLRTWLRVEYSDERIDEIFLVEQGTDSSPSVPEHVGKDELDAQRVLD